MAGLVSRSCAPVCSMPHDYETATRQLREIQGTTQNARRLTALNSPACQRENSLGMQVVREQRSQELVDALERERLLGWHCPAPCIGSRGPKPHLGPAGKAAQLLVTVSLSGNPAQTDVRPPTVSVMKRNEGRREPQSSKSSSSGKGYSTLAACRGSCRGVKCTKKGSTAG